MNPMFATSNNSTGGGSVLAIIACTAIFISIFAYAIVLIAQSIKGFKDNYVMSMLKLVGGLVIIVLYIYGISELIKQSKENNFE